jgi:hypothetical protein
LQFYKGRQLFISVHNEASGVTAICAHNPIDHSSQSTVATQPRLKPALPRLAAVISQYFMQRILASLLSTQQSQNDFNCRDDTRARGRF